MVDRVLVVVAGIAEMPFVSFLYADFPFSFGLTISEEGGLKEVAEFL